MVISQEFSLTFYLLATTQQSESLSTIICTVPTPHTSPLDVSIAKHYHVVCCTFLGSLFHPNAAFFLSHNTASNKASNNSGNNQICLLALLLGSKCQRWSSQKMFVRLEASFLRVKLVSNVCIVVCSCVKLSFFPTFFLDVCVPSGNYSNTIPKVLLFFFSFLDSLNR